MCSTHVSVISVLQTYEYDIPILGSVETNIVPLVLIIDKFDLLTKLKIRTLFMSILMSIVLLRFINF